MWLNTITEGGTLFGTSRLEFYTCHKQFEPKQGSFLVFHLHVKEPFQHLRPKHFFVGVGVEVKGGGGKLKEHRFER